MDSKLRSDFPIDWEEDGYVSRREFFKFLTVASGGLAVASIGLAAWSKLNRNQRTFDPKRIASLDGIAPGTSIQFDYPRKEDLCILIKRKDSSLIAFSQRCTHLSCPVHYQQESEALYCPCHNGAFSAVDGTVLQGPPPRPLPQITLEIRNNEVWAVGVQEFSEKK